MKGRTKKSTPGQKFGNHELLGIPVRVVLSEKLCENQELEIVTRDNLDHQEVISEKDLLSTLKGLGLLI